MSSNNSNTNVYSVNSNNSDLVWSEIGKVWISKTEFALDSEEEEEEEEEDEEIWSDAESEDEISPLTRRRQSWQEIAIASSFASRRRLTDEVKEVKEEDNQECTSECAICYDCFAKNDACSTTPCGHKFHSKCLFQNFEHRAECPLCRTELIKQPEEEEYSDDDDEEDDEEEEEEEEPKQIVSIKQMADKLASLRYTMEDLLMMHFGGSDHPKDIANPRWSADLGDEED